MSDLLEHISRKARKIKGKLTSSASISSNLSATTSMNQALRSLHDSAGLFPLCKLRSQLGSKHRKEFKDLASKLTSLSKLLERHIKTSQSTHVSEFLERLAASVKEQVTIISSLQNSGRAGHLRKAMQDEDEILDGYRRITEILEELQTEASLKMWNIAEQQLANSHLKSLSPVHLAAYNSSLSEDANRRSCTEGTRVNILASSTNVSTGTWALGASFFCTRTSNECQDVRQIVPTIAYQLARHWPSFRSALLGILEQEPEIQSQAITILRHSRPEADIRHRVEAQPGQNRLMCVLHDIEESLVQADITLYLRAELASSDVSEFNVTQLASLSGKLFIYAATAVRYIRQAGTMVDQDRLEAILSSASDSDYRHSEINQLYTTILDTAVYQSNREPREQDKDECTAPVAILRAARIAGHQHGLHPPCILPDYIFDEARSKRFYCDETKHSQLLCKHCFDIMRDQLRFNICGLETSFIADSEVKDLKARIIGRSRQRCRDADEARRIFLESLLFWMEVLSLKGTLDMGIAMLSLVKPWLTAKESPSNLVKIIDDSWIFVSRLLQDRARSRHRIYTSQHSHFAIRPVGSRSNTKSYSAFAITGRLGSRGESNGASCNVEDTVGTLCVAFSSGAHGGVNSVALSPDGSMLASGSGDGTILVRDAQTGNRIYDVIKGHEGEVTSVCFSPDGKYILSGSGDRQRGFLCTAFSPDGKHIACGLASISVPLLFTTHPPASHSLFHSTLINPGASIAFLPNGNNLVTGHESGDLRVWSLHNGTATHSPPKVHNGWVTSIGFSPLGDKLVTGSWIVASCSSDGTVKMWNPLHSALSHTPRWKAPTKAVLSVAISPDGSRIAAAGGDRAIYMFNARDGTAAVEPLVAHTDWIRSIAFSPNGSYYSGPLRGHQGWVLSISFSPDDKRIVSASHDKTIRMWDVGDGTLTAIDLVGTREEGVCCATFSPDGGHIVSGCEDGKICMWDLHSLSLVSDPFGSQWHKGSINSVTFSPDGQLVASGSDDGTICVFDSAAAICHIVSGSFDGSVRVWVVKDGAPACEPLRGHQDWVRSVAYSPDGRYIVSGSDDSTIRVWKASGGGVISDLSHSAPSALDERQTHRAIAGGLTMSQDGWIRNQDSQLVFWAPSDVRRVFPGVGNVYTIGPEGTLHTDYSQPLLLGEEWGGCYVGAG
ncbi:WD40 repeat-like protein [Rhizoctonia solani]|uniref:WD40 repeat-like protein n=1 Tax=Rhizoctonia solani TaxID=456999 RepID=A0A8H7M1G8_9AGAM|nr:WD40 repeat-like protein [Rhizoctonia solani]